MVRAIRVYEQGGPDVMKFEELDIGEPGEGEAKIRHEAIGLNYLDTYFRSGLYPAPAGLPMTPGNEGAGIVVSVGPGVTGLEPGDRVAYVGPLGSYAEERLVAADRLVKVPDAIDSRTAAGMMLKGMTASYLLQRTFPVKPGDIVLFHAAAGGVGLIAGQWAKHLGATVIGTAGSPEKVDLALANGYDHVIDYSKENFVERVTEITGGEKCDVVYDSVGATTYPGSLDCLKPLGTWVSFGQSAGPIKDFSLPILSAKGSLFATRPTLFTYIAKRADLERYANALFDVVGRGIVKIAVNQDYALADAVKAHKDLEGRRTTGTTVLLP